MQQVLSALEQADCGTVLQNEPLAPHTTWKIGGPADIMVIPHSKEQLVRAVKTLHRLNAPWITIGKGSNTLVTDKGVRGTVVKLGDELATLRFEGNLVYAGASLGMIKLSILAAKRGLTGLEFAGGIPGTVGGAVFMNAGAHGSDVSRVLKSAEVLLENGELAVMDREELMFSYRHSILQRMRAIVTEAVFELAPGDRNEIAAAMATYKDRRLKTQPFSSACAGSVFRNPEGHHAAKLIEEAGLKGLRVGGAEISPLHANFIVNTGGATASDVLTLMDRARTLVYERFGVELVPEVLVVGER